MVEVTVRMEPGRSHDSSSAWLENNKMHFFHLDILSLKSLTLHWKILLPHVVFLWLLISQKKKEAKAKINRCLKICVKWYHSNVNLSNVVLVSHILTGWLDWLWTDLNLLVWMNKARDVWKLYKILMGLIWATLGLDTLGGLVQHMPRPIYTAPR